MSSNDSKFNMSQPANVGVKRTSTEMAEHEHGQIEQHKSIAKPPKKRKTSEMEENTNSNVPSQASTSFVTSNISGAIPHESVDDTSLSSQKPNIDLSIWEGYRVLALKDNVYYPGTITDGKFAGHVGVKFDDADSNTAGPVYYSNVLDPSFNQVISDQSSRPNM